MSITDTAPLDDGTPTGDTPVAEPVEAVSSEEPGGVDTYNVTVDGEEHQVTLDELRNGYSRQQDYTRKTQQLADMRKRLGQVEALADALDRDPIGTLKALNEAYKVPAEDKAAWDEMDPQEQRIVKLEHELAEQRARDARNTIDREFTQLEAEFGDIDRKEVAQFALRNDLTVTDAYRVLHFDGLRAEKERLAEEAKVVQNKRDAKLPHNTGGTQRSAVTPNAQGKKLNVHEAFLAAKQELGIA